MDSNAESQAYNANLDYTLKELQKKVKEHEDELERLRSKGDDIDPSPIAQARVAKIAFEEVTDSEPFMPFPGSILPALIALRRTHKTIVESKAYLATKEAEIEGERRGLDADENRLRDQQLLTEALNERVSALERELASSVNMQPEDGARQQRDELNKRKGNFDRDGKKLFRALNTFIDKNLAVLLAAEELGGPVVGDIMDIEGEDLAEGFSAQGKLKKPKDRNKNDMRQQRLDELWRSANTPGGEREGQGNEEVAAAGAEIKELIQALIEQLQEAKGDNSASYVTLARESAATRFLVRSKVAQLHPKDASRVRLIDFARNLED